MMLGIFKFIWYFFFTPHIEVGSKWILEGDSNRFESSIIVEVVAVKKRLVQYKFKSSLVRVAPIYFFASSYKKLD